MNPETADIGSQDRAIEREEDDALDRGSFVDSLVAALIREEIDVEGRVVGRVSRGHVVGLTGDWGLGKSSILNLVRLKLDGMDHVTVALFNPWLFSGRDELLRGFFSELRDAMGRSGSEKAREMVAALDRYWGAIDLAAHASAAFVDLHGAGGAATRGWTAWKDRFRALIRTPTERSPQEERRALERKLASGDGAIVVLVDELDRVEDDEVRAVAQLIKAVGDVKGISYLVAYDPDRVAEALGRGDRKRGASYLEKIVQFPVPLRPLFRRDKEMLIDAALGDAGPAQDPEDEHAIAVRSELLRLVSTPRDVKRLVGAYSILEAAVRGEVCRSDVLGYAWIVTKAPALRSAIAAGVDDLVDDPEEPTMAARIVRQMNKEPPQTASEVLGAGDSTLEPLLTRLFPRFAEGHAERWDRIGRRRNLLRLLYLGNPPDMVPRSAVERVWGIEDPVALRTELTDLQSAGRLRAFMDRVDDLHADLDPAQDGLFWTALADLLPRRQDWARGPDQLRAIAEDATASVVRLAVRDRTKAHRVAKIVDALVAAGDLVLAPSILRKQMFANGLTRHSRRAKEEGALGLRETEALMEREMPRYREAVLDGTALRRLPNVEAVFVLANAERWDAGLRAAFLDQLQGAPALSTFAALVVPPGYGVDRSTLDELADADLIGERVSALPADEWPQDPYLDSCLRRLLAAATGADPDLDEPQ